MAYFRLTPLAKSSLRQIAIHTQKTWGKEQRNKYVRQMDAVFQELATHPQMGRVRDDLSMDLRSYPAGKHIAFYRVEIKQIVIVNILHQHMDPGLHL